MAITKSKVTEEHMFKDRKPIRKKLLLIGKKKKDYNNLFSRLYKICKQKTHHEILFKRRKHNRIQVGQDYYNQRCAQNQLYHKVYLLILSTKLCLWNKYSKISINRCWKLPIL
jgi:hypothetical protein